MSRAKPTMTPKWRASLIRARAARVAKAQERGAYLTPEGAESLRAHRRKAIGEDHHRAKDDVDALIAHLFDIFAEKQMLLSELSKRTGISCNGLRDWRDGVTVTPTLEAFRKAAWALGYVLKLEPFEKPKSRDVSTWPAPREHYRAGAIK